MCGAGFVYGRCGRSNPRVEERARRDLFEYILCAVSDTEGARNIGLDMSEGEYVWFIDGDDYLTDMQAFSKLIEAMRESKRPVGYLKKFDSEKPVPENWAAWRFFYKRSFIDGIRFPDLPIDEDIKFFVNVSKRKGFCVTLIRASLYHHTFPGKGSIVTKYYQALL